MSMANLATQQRRAVEVLIQRVSLDNAERLQFISMHEIWRPDTAYGSNQYLQFTPEGETEPWLFRSTRNVPANAPPPNVPTQPANFVRIT